jgi:hypothetical protein
MEDVNNVHWQCPICDEKTGYPFCLLGCGKISHNLINSTGHTVCESCTTKLKEKKCPFCRLEFDVAKPNYALGKICGMEFKTCQLTAFNFEEEAAAITKLSQKRREAIEERVIKYLFETAKKRIIANPLWAGYLINVDNQTLKETLSDLCISTRISCQQAQDLFETIKKRLAKLNEKQKDSVIITSIAPDTRSQGEEGSFCLVVGIQVSKT